MTVGSDGWSMGEVRSLAVKAARGAGLDWGVAEEAGYAVRWLETSGAPGCQALANYLELISVGPVPANQCPLRIGMRLLDFQTPHPVELDKIVCPLLVVPFIAGYAVEPCKLYWPGVVILIFENGLRSRASRQELLQLDTTCHTSIGTGEKPQFTIATRVSPDQQPAIAQLEAQAAKTYAPATEASRNKGAGAARNDND